MNPSEVFTYLDFNLDDARKTVSFNYQVEHAGESFNFTETLTLPGSLADSYEVSYALRALHIALGISYYKLFVPSIIQHSYAMNEFEAHFWNEVWRNGLGEFMYVNKLSIDRLAIFQPQEGKTVTGNKTSSWQEKAFLGIGGGKDSIVAGELLKECGISVTGFVLGTGAQQGQSKAVADTMGIALLTVERILDPLLIKLNNRDDALNGHIPISVIFGFVGSLLAATNNSRYVVVANEASASIPRITHGDQSVNHQWSKSLEFENLLQKYLQDINPQLTYFSAVRPLNSVALAKIFTQFPSYLEVFTSDNSVFKIDPSKRPNDRWSLESPKSLSSFILLAPWVEEGVLVGAFRRNFLDEASLEPLLLRLIGVQGEPPLDCVGTSEELQASLAEIIRQNKFADATLIKMLRAENKIDIERSIDQFLALEQLHSIPETLESDLLGEMRARLLS
jgi:UDP-N-acetyl-alpha-D-muramoyl-L-alanyl-L-glutamate epimerase